MKKPGNKMYSEFCDVVADSYGQIVHLINHSSYGHDSKISSLLQL